MNTKQVFDLSMKPLTDSGNAERLEAIIGLDWRYVPQIKRWLHWNGKQWQETEKAVLYVAAVNALRILADNIDRLPKAPDETERERRVRVINWLEKSENLSKVVSALGILEGMLPAEYKDFDNNPYLINVQNGTINLNNGKLQNHNQSDHITKICTVPYDEYPKGLLWVETVKQILPDDGIRRWMQKFIGYCMTGSTQEEKFVIACGPGGCGKGTFFETIAAVLGDYKAVIPIDILLATGIIEGGNNPTPELAKLPGKRYVLSSESGKGRRLDEAKVKLITGGDTITARRLHAEAFEFRPAFKLILQTNYMPSITDSLDKGIRRRLVIIPFVAKIEKQNLKLKQELLRPENLIECLNWCIEGAKLWKREGLGELPEEAKITAEKFYAENDLLQQWLDERTEAEPNGFLRFEAALKDFNNWLSAGGSGVTYQRKGFSEVMERHGKTKIRRNTGYGYMGIALKWKDDRR